MSVILDIDMPKTARDCIFNQPAPFRGDFCIINNVCTFPDGCPLHEQKTGKWIESGYWSEGVGMGEVYGCKYRCSECGTEVNGGEDRCGVNFCHNCGAKMDDEKEIDFFTQGHLHLGEAEVE